LVFPSADKTFDAFVWFWKPKESLEEAVKKDGVPYHLWAQSQDLELTEGKVIKLAPIAKKMAELSDHRELKNIAYDRYRHKELDSEMSDLGIELPMIEHPQGFRRAGKINDDDNPLWMPKSVEELENSIIENRIRINVNRVLRWNVSSVAIRHDPAGTDNRIFDKRKSTGRIDGIVALAMAVGLAVANPNDEKQYQAFVV
jgi:phage terminase large subunit-like protein